MGPLGLVFNIEAMKTIADLPSQSQDYVGEGLIRTISNIGGTSFDKTYG
jgi:hypothetical protein